MPRHFSEDEKKIIEQELLQAGLELFEQYGLNKTNVGDITARVGISKGAFYNFFNSKGDLFMKVYQMEREYAQACAEMRLGEGAGGLRAALLGYMTFIREKLKERPILNIAYDRDAFAAVTDKSVRESMLAYNHRLNNRISVMVQGWLDKFDCQGADPDVIAAMMRAVFLIKYHEHAFDPEVFERAVEGMMESTVLYAEQFKRPE